ncbi:hypothetical protein J0I05_04015 [Candidatus Saccharibacteria bacterium]|nr:hypothetical protein [Candidatus Saccharibacteria bacterium]
MSNTQQIKTNNTTNVTQPQKTSSLQRFTIGFEYNKTLQEIKHEVRMRTI